MKREEYNGYKMGALKRKFGTGRVAVPPGSFIEKANAAKTLTRKSAPMGNTERIAFMGAV